MKMELKQFIRSVPLDQREGFAQRCGTSLNYLKLVAYKAKPCSERLAIAIERESAGAVTVEELRPDVPWHVIRNGQARRQVEDAAP